MKFRNSPAAVTMNVALCLTLAVLFASTVQLGSAIDMCTTAQCDCRLPSVNSQGRSFTKTVDGKMCICICGSEVNEACKSDGQCVPGAYCKFDYSSADGTFSAEGKCNSNCNRKECPQFHECRIGTTGEATCSCSTFPCDHSVVVPICAAGQEDRTIRRFNNTCLFVNENCNRKEKGLGELKSFVCMGS